MQASRLRKIKRTTKNKIAQIYKSAQKNAQFFQDKPLIINRNNQNKKLKKECAISWFLLPVLLLLGNLCMAQSITPADALPGEYVPLLQHKRVALVINQTSVVGDSSLLDMLMSRGVKVVRIFVPEHGFRGNEDAGGYGGEYGGQRHAPAGGEPVWQPQAAHAGRPGGCGHGGV